MKILSQHENQYSYKNEEKRKWKNDSKESFNHQLLNTQAGNLEDCKITSLYESKMAQERKEMNQMNTCQVMQKN